MTVMHLDSPATTSATKYTVVLARVSGSNNILLPATIMLIHLQSIFLRYHIMSELRTNRIVPRDGLVSGTGIGGGIIQVKQTILKTQVEVSHPSW